MSKVAFIALFFCVFTLINQLNADGSDCEQSAILDMARDAIVKAKSLYSNCDEAENDPNTCGIKGKSLAYLEVAKALILTAKNNSQTCPPVQENRPIDCSDVLKQGHTESGVYSIWPNKNRSFSGRSVKVYCDMKTDSGGWTVIQRRGNFTLQEDFYRDWADYKAGFGNVEKDFWLGNDNIHALTNQEYYSVRFDLEDVKGEKRYAVYREFWILEEATKYLLHITNYNGNAGDSMKDHNNHIFLTRDKPDKGGREKCAETRKSGWWFDYCTKCNPNGVYQPGKKGLTGVTWYAFRNLESLAAMEIKVKRTSLLNF